MNTRKIFGYGTIAVVLTLAFTALSLTGCENDPPTIIPQTVTYISEDSDGNLYTLVIEENTKRSGRYAARKGDKFTFTVELFNNGTYSLALTYSGTVDSTTAKGGTGIEIKITVNDKELAITISDTTMTLISGEIVDEDGDEVVKTPGGLTLVTDKTTLEKVLNAAKTTKEAVAVSADGADILTTAYWVTQAQMDSFTSAIATAQAFYDADDADQSMITSARIALAAAATVFNGQKQPGTKTDDTGTPGLEYELIDNETAYRVSAGTVTSGSVVIPATYDGLPVTEIGDWAFSNSSLTEIHIPASVTSIGWGAFYSCSSLTSITIPASVTSIGNGAFYSCSSLTSITIPASVTSIGIQAFYQCASLTSITIPASVTSIGEYAFAYCDGLTSVTIPEGVTSIGSGAFYRCTSLTNITVDANNPHYASEDGILYNKAKTTLIQAPSKGISSAVTIPASVTSIGIQAFYQCASLTSITIPAGVTSIGEYAFAYCDGLTSVTIPEGVTSIGSGAFYRCTSLTEITIPEGVTSIGSDAFYNCTSLTSITIPESVTSIGGYAFSACTSLTSITIPEGVTSIGNSAFSGCNGLTSITIPAGVTFIGTNAFNSCTSLTNITIPSGVTFIGDSTFSYCTSLTEITIPEGVTSIDGQAFLGCTSLTSVTIPASVTSIGESAFGDCTGLTSITIPAGVTEIGRGTFYGWNSTQTINVPWSSGNKPDGWDSGWNYACDAQIVYQQ